MKFALSALALASVANAFVVQPSSSRAAVKALNSENSYSYLGNLNESTGNAPSVPGAAAPQGNSSLAKARSTFAEVRATQDIISDAMNTVVVQGGALRTCSFNEDVGRVTVYLKTEGRPLNANVDLWQGPDNAPQKMSVYLEDGSIRPFRATIESPGSSNAVAIRNTGQIEFPLTAALDVDTSGTPESPAEILIAESSARTVQGGAVYTTPFPPSVQSVQVALKSDGRPLNARVELLQGPNNNKQVMEIYTEDGLERPFYVIIDTPGNGNVVRIVNTATVEFPLTAAVEPYIIDDEISGTPGGMIWS